MNRSKSIQPSNNQSNNPSIHPDSLTWLFWNSPFNWSFKVHPSSHPSTDPSIHPNSWIYDSFELVLFNELFKIHPSIYPFRFKNIWLFWTSPFNVLFKIHLSIPIHEKWLLWTGSLINCSKSIHPSRFMNVWLFWTSPFNISILILSHSLFPTIYPTMTSKIKPRIPYDLCWVFIRLWHSMVPIYNCHRSINLLKHIRYPSTKSIGFHLIHRFRENTQSNLAVEQKC